MAQKQIQKGKQRKGGDGHSVRQTVQYGRPQQLASGEAAPKRSQRSSRPEKEEDLIKRIDGLVA